MKRSLMGYLGATAFAAAVLVGSTAANAASWRAGGIIGGMSAAEVVGGPYGPYVGYGYYPAEAYVRPNGPPPGCVIRQQRMWDGYGWRWRKLRLCH